MKISEKLIRSKTNPWVNFVNELARFALLLMVKIWTVGENGMITIKEGKINYLIILGLPFIWKPHITEIINNFQSDSFPNVHFYFVRFILSKKFSTLRVNHDVIIFEKIEITS